MAISMNEIILHQHREKCLSSYIRNQPIQIMLVILVIRNGLTINELLDQNFISRLREGLWESDILINDESIKFIDIFLLMGKVQLLG